MKRNSLAHTGPLRSLSTALIFSGALLSTATARAENRTSADGPGGTYDLLKQSYTVEVPDCGHPVDHVTEVFDDELGIDVFVFHAHVDEDDDRCKNFDRQRTEIRAKSSDIVASEGETVHYRWLFQLPDGFQGSPNFTHIFQIKSNAAAPVMTLTPRTDTFAIDGRIGERGKTALAPFIGAWVVVDLSVFFSNAGSLSVSIRRLSDGEVLLSYSGDADMWDDDQSGHDSKFGIYRSLNSSEYLRDEQVRFAEFCASKIALDECDLSFDLGTGGSTGMDPNGAGGADGSGGNSGLPGIGGTNGNDLPLTGGAFNGSGGNGVHDPPNGGEPSDGNAVGGFASTDPPDTDPTSAEPSGCAHAGSVRSTRLPWELLVLLFTPRRMRRRQVAPNSSHQA